MLRKVDKSVLEIANSRNEAWSITTMQTPRRRYWRRRCQEFHDFRWRKTIRTNLLLDIFLAVVLYTKIYFKLTVQYIDLLLLNVSAKNCSHLQRATVPEDALSVLCILLAGYCGLYTYCIIPQIVNSYWNCIKIIVEIAF